MQEVTGSIPVFCTKKALYFVGSMVLFFLLKPVFGTAFLRLHRFQAFAGGSYTTPAFDFTPFSKRNVCRPVFQQAAASSPSIDAAKGGGFPQ